ncbi:hypothetical protein Anapl_02507 [Anas platyrhynchos]|uniref:Uncharacterized protein n=1 Tax=Anas platyrhynchos TaxID=8839 RepID=R0LGF7_ANAPL|nr:hypothetical protein Anapl_02507 [Anas platyrhynchos]
MGRSIRQCGTEWLCREQQGHECTELVGHQPPAGIYRAFGQGVETCTSLFRIGHSVGTKYEMRNVLEERINTNITSIWQWFSALVDEIQLQVREAEACSDCSATKTAKVQVLLGKHQADGRCYQITLCRSQQAPELIEQHPSDLESTSIQALVRAGSTPIQKKAGGK